MKRLLCIVSALSLSAAACAEQPGKKKEEDKDGKVETKPVDSGGKPSAAKPEAKTDGK